MVNASTSYSPYVHGYYARRAIYYGVPRRSRFMETQIPVESGAEDQDGGIMLLRPLLLGLVAARTIDVTGWPASRPASRLSLSLSLCLPLPLLSLRTCTDPACGERIDGQTDGRADKRTDGPSVTMPRDRSIITAAALARGLVFQPRLVRSLVRSFVRRLVGRLARE